MSESAADQRRALERAVNEDPGAPGFAALAELQRRSGRLEEAEGTLRRGLDRKPDAHEGRLVLALCLIDLGRTAEARAELERLTDEQLLSHALTSPSSGAPQRVSDSEFDAAFADVSTDVERLVDPNRVAEEAVAYVDGPRAGRRDASLFESLEGSPFATSTMAELLERQGDVAGASRIRAAVEASARSADESDDSTSVRDRVVARLERWLVNLRGDPS
jgi:tetratricopeptide (TPR) repeat protein